MSEKGPPGLDIRKWIQGLVVGVELERAAFESQETLKEYNMAFPGAKSKIKVDLQIAIPTR